MRLHLYILTKLIKNNLFKKTFKLYWTFLSLLLTACTTNTINPVTLQNQIDNVTTASGTHATRGIAIQSMQTNQIIYAKNINLPFVPASNMKLFTAAAALLYLGPHYQYHTTIYANNNNVYMKFTGDPDLTAQQINSLIWQLKQKGINKINGNFYIDNSQYDGYDIAPGWMWDDLKYCFAAPTDAIMINHNCIIPLNTALDDNDPAIQFPYHTATVLIAKLLHQNNILLKGKILSGTVNHHATIIADQTSPHLWLLVNQMLKNSDNLIANSLLKNLGAIYFQQAGNWDSGVIAMQNILKQHYHIDFSQSKIVDGSGLSRYDLITPQQTLQLLNYIYHDQTISPYFINALPIAGYDGTLKNRMLTTKMVDRIYAKTGTQLVNSRDDVQKLTLTNNELTPDSINQMATVLNNSSLTELKLNDNLLGDAAIPHIIKIIRQNPKLTSLTLSNNLFTKEGFMTLLPALCSHRVLKDVDLSVQQFNFESFSPDDINKIKFLISNFGDNLSLTFSFAEAAYEFKDILEINVRRANDADNENRRLGI